MSWEFVKYRIRRRAESAVCAISSYLHGDDEGTPEENLEEYLRQRARIREYEEGML